MTYTIWETRPLYVAVTTRLETTGKLVGQAISPGGNPPYMVLYPSSDSGSEGSLSDPHQVVVQTFQVTCVGDSMMEAQWMQHKARGVLVGHRPSVSGWKTESISLDFGSGVFRDPDGPVFYTTDRFAVFTTPS